MTTKELEGQLDILDALKELEPVARRESFAIPPRWVHKYPEHSLFEVTAQAFKELRSAWDAHHIATEEWWRLYTGRQMKAPESTAEKLADEVTRYVTAPRYVAAKERLNALELLGKGGLIGCHIQALQEMGLWELHQEMRNAHDH